MLTSVRYHRICFAAGMLAVFALALAVRLPRLVQRPMHGDEANQAVKAGLLFESGAYDYDPADHHGPSLYWLTLPSLRLSGAADLAHSDEFSYRVVPVVFGAGMILMLFLLCDGLGRGPTLVAALLTAISPAMVFYSRYYIQETLLVFFTLGAIATAWRYVRSRSLGWALAAGGCVGLMHATKETWVIAAAAMAAAVALAIVWPRWVLRPRVSGELGTVADGPSPVRSYFRPVPLIGAVAAACVVAVVFYSSCGRDWRGPIHSLTAYAAYLRRGSAGGLHAHPWYYYLELLVAYRPQRGFFWSEGLIVGLAVVGAIRSCLMTNSPHPLPLSRSRERGAADDSPPDASLCRFLAFYTLILTALYSAIPYKTPWCMLTFLSGMILLAGVGAGAIFRWLPGVFLKACAGALLAAGVAHLGWECYALSFDRHYLADQRNPYVYAHTSTNLLDLAATMDRLAQVAPEGHETVIHVVTSENEWPLPWYLRQFNPDRVGYWHDPGEWSRKTQKYPPPSVIIFTADLQPQIDANLRAAYNQQMIYGLRPAVLLQVYVREDLWQAMLSHAEHK